MTPSERDGWEAAQQYVLHDIEKLAQLIGDMRKEQQDFRERMIAEVTALKVKSGIWGAVGGMIPVGIALVYMILEK